MYTCKKCGSQVPEGNKFCGSCGCPVEETSQDQGQKKIIINDFDQIKNKGQTFDKRKKSGKIKFILPLIALLVIGLVVLIPKLTNKEEVNPFVKTLNVSNFINEPVFVGNDGEGVVDTDSLYIDENLLEKKLDELLGEDKYISTSEIASNFVLTAEPIEDLKNGDTVTVLVEMRNKENIQDSLGIRFTSPNRDFKVVGLKDFFTIDPFDGFVPEFSGISPKVRVDISNSKIEGNTNLEKYLGSARYYYDIYKDGKIIDDDKSLEIGDKIVFKFNQEGIDRLHENSYKPSVLEKEHTISQADVPSYITSMDQVEDRFFEEIKTQANSIMKAYLASRGNAEEPKYLGCYFLTPKANGWQQSGWSGYKIPVMHLIYSYQYHGYDDEVEDRFCSIKVYNFINEKIDLGPDETLDPETKAEQTINYDNIEKISRDYDSLEELFLDLIESNLEYYTYENTEGMKDF